MVVLTIVEAQELIVKDLEQFRRSPIVLCIGLELGNCTSIRLAEVLTRGRCTGEHSVIHGGRL